MSEIGEYWRDVKPALKQAAKDKREEEFDDKLEYAKQQFEKNNIPYKLCNPSIGHFNLYYKGKVVISFWSYTGKIMGQDTLRGIKNCIKCYNNKVNKIEAAYGRNKICLK